MNRLSPIRFPPLPWPWLWPLLVGLLSLTATAWLWQHEQQTQERRLRDNFDFSLRQAATRVEQRMASYEQMLRGARGLFDASDDVSRADFAAYVGALVTGADFAGLRTLGYAPLLSGDGIQAHVARQRRSGAPGYTVFPAGVREWMAPLTYVAPAADAAVNALGGDGLAEPERRAAMLRARDSGAGVITRAVQPRTLHNTPAAPIFLMYMPVYAKGLAVDTVAARRAHLRGWVVAGFGVVDLMSSLYGEGIPGLDVRVHDGTGLSEESLLYPPVAGPPPDRRPRFEAQEYIAFGGHTWTLSVRSRPGFEQLYSNDSARIILMAGGGLSLLLMLLAWQLATARERAEAVARTMTRQLRDSAERYRRIVETANEGIWMVDADGRTSFTNPKMQALLGYGGQAMLGRPWADFAEFVDDKQGVLAHGADPQQRQACFRRHDGSELWATFATSAILDADNRPAGVLAMVTDITERKQAEANRAVLEGQLRQSQKMEAIGTLAGGIAHDFNNILAAVLGNVSLAQEALDAGHPALPRLEQIRIGSERARSLVQQIVTFSRQQPQVLVVQPLRPLLEEAVTLLRSTLPALVELHTRFDDEALFVGADATQFQQVLMNLCTNAWHAMKGSTGQIVIGLDRAPPEGTPTTTGVPQGPALGDAHVWVSDNGSGMDEATRQRAFEPFFTTKPVGHGTGLGLSVVHGIVSSHGGRITVASKPGQGSRFDLYFPLAEAPPPAPARPLPAVVQGQGQQVLYVDDDLVMVLMAEGLLQRRGYRVTCMTNPLDALRRLRATPPGFDVLVTDFNMPELSGLDLAREVHRLHPRLPIIITSGYVSESLRADVQQAGVRHVLQKEYTLEQLPSVVQEALAASTAG